LIFELDFLTSSNWIFAGYQAVKIKLKNQFYELDISKIKRRWIGDLSK